MKWIMEKDSRRILFKRVALMLSIALERKTAFANENWQETIHKDGIRIFTRDVESSGYPEVKGEVVLNATPEQLVTLFQNAKGYRAWLDGCIESKLLARKGLFEHAFYTRTDLPWPFNDREIVSSVSFQRNPETGTIIANLQEIDFQVPQSENVVRVETFRSRWIIQPLSQDSSRLVIRMFIEPGGNLKPVFVNLTVSHIQFETMKNLRNLTSNTALQALSTLEGMPVTNSVD
jgi:hypothetical protein